MSKMNNTIEYRLWNKIGKRYFTKKDSERAYLTPTGRVMSYSEIMGFIDITDQVIIEQWTGLFDKNRKKIYVADIIKADWHFDTPIPIEDLPYFYYETIEYALDDNLEIVGNVHDEIESK